MEMHQTESTGELRATTAVLISVDLPKDLIRQENPMSQFRKFQDAVMADEALQGQLDALIGNPDFNDESLIEFAEQNGFQIMQEDLDATARMISDESLEVVVGGAGGAGNSSPDGLMADIQQSQMQNQMFNMRFLQLQESAQKHNREYSAMSNIMKVRHDTAKTAIQNMRS